MREWAPELLSRLPSSSPVVGVEVGVFRGRSSALLLREREDLYLTMVDSWMPVESQPAAYVASGDMHARLSAKEQERNRFAAMKAVEFAGGRAWVVRACSHCASKLVNDGTQGFVFLDAEHTFLGVLRDIWAWAPKVRPGGLLGGHDYDYAGPHDFQVRRAVDYMAARRGWDVEEGAGSTWWVEVP